jgi:hypothetical protein
MSSPALIDNLSSCPDFEGAAPLAGQTNLATTQDRPDRSEKWARIIDLLLQWFADPDSVADNQVDAPSHDAIRNAVQMAMNLQDRESECPSIVAPSGDGGIVFERDFGGIELTMRFEEDGTVSLEEYGPNGMIEQITIS